MTWLVIMLAISNVGFAILYYTWRNAALEGRKCVVRLEARISQQEILTDVMKEVASAIAVKIGDSDRDEVQKSRKEFQAANEAQAGQEGPKRSEGQSQVH